MMQSESEEKFLLQILLDTVYCGTPHDFYYDKFTLVGNSQSGKTKTELQSANQTIATEIIKTYPGKSYEFPPGDNSLLFADYVKPSDFVSISLTALDIDLISEQTWRDKYAELAKNLANLTKDAVDKATESRSPGIVSGESAIIDGSVIAEIVKIFSQYIPDLVGGIMGLDDPDVIGKWSPRTKEREWMTGADWHKLAEQNNGKHSMLFMGDGWNGGWSYEVHYKVHVAPERRLRLFD